MEMLLLLIFAHFAVDYQFQSDAVAVGKNFSIDKKHLGVDWYYWLSSHAATHSLAVYLITGSIWATIFQFVAHFAIDYLKCGKYITLHQDQIMHIITMVYIVWFL